MTESCIVAIFKEWAEEKTSQKQTNENKKLSSRFLTGRESALYSVISAW